jgi:hypothetical protein
MTSRPLAINARGVVDATAGEGHPVLLELGAREAD